MVAAFPENARDRVVLPVSRFEIAAGFCSPKIGELSLKTSWINRKKEGERDQFAALPRASGYSHSATDPQSTA
jgi:hypothetical protein